MLPYNVVIIIQQYVINAYTMKVLNCVEFCKTIVLTLNCH